MPTAQSVLSARRLVAALNDTDSGFLSRTELAMASGLSYSRSCALLNEFSEYFKQTENGLVKTVCVSPDDISFEDNVNKTKPVGSNSIISYEHERDDKMLALLSDIAAAIRGEDKGREVKSSNGILERLVARFTKKASGKPDWDKLKMTYDGVSLDEYAQLGFMALWINENYRRVLDERKNRQ